MQAGEGDEQSIGDRKGMAHRSHSRNVAQITSPMCEPVARGIDVRAWCATERPRGTVNDCNLPVSNASRSPNQSPVCNLLVERLGGVGKGVVFRGVRDGRSNARLSVFAKRPAETAIAQKIGFNPDRERVIFCHPDNMRPRRTVF